MTRVRIILEALIERDLIKASEVQALGDLGDVLADNARIMTGLPFKYVLGFGVEPREEKKQ